MKQSWLNSLKGLLLVDAERLVKAEGLTPHIVPKGVAITLQARPNTVVLWEDNALVTAASAGDGLEVEEG